jgi:hypothetical protein
MAGTVSSTLRQKIEKRAYDLYQKRVGGQGCDFDDWLRAEREIMEEESRKASQLPSIKPSGSDTKPKQNI